MTDAEHPSADPPAVLPPPQPGSGPTGRQIVKLLAGSFILGFFGCGMALIGGTELFFGIGGIVFVVSLFGFLVGVGMAVFVGIRGVVRSMSRKD